MVGYPTACGSFIFSMQTCVVSIFSSLSGFGKHVFPNYSQTIPLICEDSVSRQFYTNTLLYMAQDSNPWTLIYSNYRISVYVIDFSDSLGNQGYHPHLWTLSIHCFLSGFLIVSPCCCILHFPRTITVTGVITVCPDYRFQKLLCFLFVCLES